VLLNPLLLNRATEPPQTCEGRMRTLKRSFRKTRKLSRWPGVFSRGPTTENPRPSGDSSSLLDKFGCIRHLLVLKTDKSILKAKGFQCRDLRRQDAHVEALLQEDQEACTPSLCVRVLGVSCKVGGVTCTGVSRSLNTAPPKDPTV